MDHINIINRLSKVIEETINNSIPGNTPLAHAWFEESFNFGDSAIWNGQIDLIKKLNLNICYSCSDKDYNADELGRAIGSNGSIMLCGGGNFSDLYTYHKLRLTILDHFKSSPIIQLPQSAKFDNEEVLEVTRQIIRAHSNITLLARDNMTLELFEKEFKSKNVTIKLCPDMAFMSGAHKRIDAPEVDIVGLLRLDRESNSTEQKGRVYNASLEQQLDLCLPLRNIYTSTDQQGQSIEFTHNVMIDPNHTVEVTDWYLMGISKNQASYKTLDYNTKAKIGVQLALSILSRGRVVVTDRLHAYILCIQMGIPHVVVDNNYGKLSAFHKTWAEDSTITHFAASMEDAFRIASDIVSSSST